MAGPDSLPPVALAVGIPLLALLIVGGIAVAWSSGERHHLHRPLAVWVAEMIAWKEQFYCGRYDDTFIALPKTPGAYTWETIRLR